MKAQLPQIIAIVKPTKAGTIGINKKIRAHLRLERNQIHLEDDGEIVIPPKPNLKSRLLMIQKGKVKIPVEDLQENLTPDGSAHFALVERGEGLAVKILTVRVVLGEWVSWSRQRPWLWCGRS